MPDKTELNHIANTLARFEVKSSNLHGKGLFATTPFNDEEWIIEYQGEMISSEEADQREPHCPENPYHTFFFQLEDGTIIDGAAGGNEARWINHSCNPNAIAYEEDGQVMIYALRPINAGEEITFDYRLVLDEELTDELKAAFRCACNSTLCHGSMLRTPDEI